MSDKVAFIKEYRALADQLGTYAIAGDWMRLAWQLRDNTTTLTAADAAAWANRGYMPGEAEPHIVEGVTPDMVDAVADATAAVDGDDDPRHAVARLLEDHPNLVVDEDLARRLGLDR